MSQARNQCEIKWQAERLTTVWKVRNLNPGRERVIMTEQLKKMTFFYGA
jgi:hypothetical protein